MIKGKILTTNDIIQEEEKHSSTGRGDVVTLNKYCQSLVENMMSVKDYVKSAQQKSYLSFYIIPIEKLIIFPNLLDWDLSCAHELFTNNSGYSDIITKLVLCHRDSIGANPYAEDEADNYLFISTRHLMPTYNPVEIGRIESGIRIALNTFYSKFDAYALYENLMSYKLRRVRD